MESNKREVNFNDIEKYIITNGKFPFEFFEDDYETMEMCSAERIDEYSFRVPSCNKIIKVVYFKKEGSNEIDDMDVTIVTPISTSLVFDSQFVYSKSCYSKKDGIMREFKRTIKEVRGYCPENSHEGKKSIDDLIYGIEGLRVSYSKIIEREENNPDIVDIDYYLSSYLSRATHGYKRIEIDKDDPSLSSVAQLDYLQIRQAIKEYEEEKKERTKRREKLLASNCENPQVRNKKILNYVKNGLTLEETLGMSLNFANNLPYSMDPMHKSFMPGEAFFKEPIDLHQENHKMYDIDGYRTLFEGMIVWGDTYENTCVIALAAFFQKMLLSDSKKYTVNDIKEFMVEKGILLAAGENNKYATDRNALLNTIAERMAEKFNMVKDSRGAARTYALCSVYDDIVSASSTNYPRLGSSIETYHWVCRDTNRIINPVSFEMVPKEKKDQKEENVIHSILSKLDRIYYNRRNVSLNSKKNHMIKLATELTNDVNYAIYLVEKYYKFDIRKVDIPSKTKTLEYVKSKQTK